MRDKKSVAEVEENGIAKADGEQNAAPEAKEGEPHAEQINADGQSDKDGQGGREAKQKRSVWQTVAYWVFLNIGTLCVAAGVYFFKSTNHFATGGVSGISIILAPYIPYLKQSDLVMIINVLLLFVGLIFLGNKVIVKTVYCSIVYSAENMLFERLFRLEAPLTGQPFMELVYAILLTGIGSAIIFNCKASSGGTDIVALILKKYASSLAGFTSRPQSGHLPSTSWDSVQKDSQGVQ